ncbi:ribosomal maturation YjgA family protein [Paenibacillus sp. IHBB 10380]|uniref:ribosomal maturation YjgA family protein n=1 Tax=Paenibacillus sp. IHBB 10380 TaxID=1566358 RepID=UPI0005CFE44C|nr:DUF2809 domain-containing protein [Paenibacillus sp. IHBB 10380]AJS58850.1 hypothetical protein UB51_10600 [Paenibacillus sp. IHBB 10380]
MRARIIYIVAVIITMILGISSRAFTDILPGIVSRHFGDALWACMIYLGVRALLIHKKLALAVLISLMFCYAIEFSQLYQADWINDIRSSLLGSLILGRGFLFVDLLRYTVGIGVCYLIDRSVMRRTRNDH